MDDRGNRVRFSIFHGRKGLELVCEYHISGYGDAAREQVDHGSPKGHRYLDGGRVFIDIMTSCFRYRLGGDDADVEFYEWYPPRSLQCCDREPYGHDAYSSRPPRKEDHLAGMCCDF